MKCFAAFDSITKTVPDLQVIAFKTSADKGAERPLFTFLFRGRNSLDAKLNWDFQRPVFNNIVCPQG
jgi:hypothetical protein